MLIEIEKRSKSCFRLKGRRSFPYFYARLKLLLSFVAVIVSLFTFIHFADKTIYASQDKTEVDLLREELQRENMPDLSGVVVTLPKAAKFHLPFSPNLGPLEPITSGYTAVSSASLTSGTDVRVTTHPAPQNETSIAINPNDQSTLVGGANDYRDGDVKCGVYASTDSGASWPSPRMLLPNPSQFNAAGDPSISFGGSGSSFYGCLGFHRQVARSGVYVYRRDNNGNISGPSQVAFSKTSATFHDKPYIAASKTADGKVYISWTRFDRGRAARVMVAGSADNGVKFTSPAPKVISDYTSNQGSSPAVASNGTVYVAWQNYNIQRILVDRSLNGGASWGTDQVVANISPIASPLPGTNFRTNSFPTMAVDPNNPDHIYVAWADYRSGNADILFADCNFSPSFSCSSPKVVHASSSFDQFFPWMSVALDGSISIVYYSRIDTTSAKMDVSVAHSRDGGATFYTQLVSDMPTDQNQGWGDFIGDYNGIDSVNASIHPLWTGGILNSDSSNNQDVFTDKISVVTPTPTP